MSHNIPLNNKINHNHEKAFRAVQNDYKSKFEDPLFEGNPYILLSACKTFALGLKADQVLLEIQLQGYKLLQYFFFKLKF